MSGGTADVDEKYFQYYRVYLAALSVLYLAGMTISLVAYQKAKKNLEIAEAGSDIQAEMLAYIIKGARWNDMILLSIFFCSNVWGRHFCSPTTI